MNENMSDMFKNLSNLLNEKGISNDKIKDLFNSSKNNNSMDNLDSKVVNKISNTESNNSNQSSQDSSNSSNFDFSNIDMDTILKLQKVMGIVNQNKNSPNATLLNSLKPYLNSERREKVDTYIQLFNIEKIIEALNISGGDKK